MTREHQTPMDETPERLRQALNALSAEIGKRKREGLACEDLVRQYRELSERLRQISTAIAAKPKKLVREQIIDLEAAGVREAWTDLLDRSDATSPSMSWEWICAWYRHFGKGHRIAIEVVKESNTNRWVGVLPLVWVSPWEVSWRFEGWLPCRHVAICGTRLGAEVDYTYPLIAQETDCAQVAELLIQALAEAQMPLVANHWDWGNQAARLLAAKATELGFSVFLDPRAIAYHALPDKFEEYISQVPQERRRSYIRAYMRHGWLEDGEFALEAIGDPEGIVSHFPLLRKFSEAKYGRFSIWRLPRYRAFVETCLRLSADRGWPVLWLLKHENEPVAASLGWLYKRACFITAMTHDLQKRDLHPGHILLTRLIKQLIEQQIDLLDMHTAEGYKTQYLSLRRMRIDPLVLVPPSVRCQGALAGSVLLSALRRRARDVALWLVRRGIPRKTSRLWEADVGKK